MLKNLKGHRALITGASSGIGEQFARQFAALGADLVIAARRVDRLQTLASELQDRYGVHVEAIQSDLTLPGAATTLFKAATQAGRPVTILVNNAGIGKWNEFWEPPMVDHLNTMQVNMVAPTELAHLCVRHMLDHRQPAYILNVSSIATFQPVEGFAVYAGTKAYLTYFSEVLDSELKGTKIRVCCLCPGGTLTEFLDHAGQKLTERGNFGMMTAERAVQIAIRGMLAGRRLVVPGALNKIAAFFPRLIPRRWALAIATQTMNQAVTRVK